MFIQHFAFLNVFPNLQKAYQNSYACACKNSRIEKNSKKIWCWGVLLKLVTIHECWLKSATITENLHEIYMNFCAQMTGWEIFSHGILILEILSHQTTMWGTLPDTTTQSDTRNPGHEYITDPRKLWCHCAIYKGQSLKIVEHARTVMLCIHFKTCSAWEPC